MKSSLKKIFGRQRMVSLLLAILLVVGIIPNFPRAQDVPLMDLDPADAETFPAKDYYWIKDTSADDEIGFVIKEASFAKYDGKRIRIPDTINGKKVVALGHPKGEDLRLYSNKYYRRTFLDKGHESKDSSSDTLFSNVNKGKVYFPDVSQATHLRFIADYAFYGHLDDVNLELKDMPNLTLIGRHAFSRIGYYVSYSNTTLNSVVMENLPRLEKIDLWAFLKSGLTEFTMKDLPALKEISGGAFTANNLTSIDLKGAPNLKKIGHGVFSKNNFAKNEDFDLRYLTKLKYIGDSFTEDFYDYSYNSGSVLIADPTTTSFEGEYYQRINSKYSGLHRLTFEFTPKVGDGDLPAALMEKLPKPYGLFVRFKYDSTSEVEYDPAKSQPLDKFTDDSNGNIWQFKGWTTNDRFYVVNDVRYAPKTIHPVKYTGEWELLCNKAELKKALEEANAKKKDVVVSANGEDQPFTKLWVTQQDQDTFTAAITTAQGVFDNENIPGSTHDERQQYIDNATTALKAAIAAYNPQAGKLTYDKNPTYAQPAGAHKVTFAKGNGIESLTDESTFYFVKDNTVLPADQFPQATAQAGFGTKIFWDPAQDTSITSDQAFTASAKAVDKTALEAKITEAEGLLANDSTSDPAVALKTKVDEAKALIVAVDNGTERNQDNVDAKVTELETAIQALKDLNTKKDEAKTAIDAIDGLSQEEKDKLKKEVDNAKNETAINEIKTKAEQQAADNKALKEATAAVEKAEADKTQAAYDAAKAKVGALKDGADKTALDGRLAEVDKYIKADDALKALEGKDIKNVTAEELTAAETLVNAVKDQWKAPLTQRLEALKTAKAAQDALTKAKEDAKNTIKALENLTDDEKAPFNKQVDDATTIPEVEKAVLDAQKADAKKKVDGMNNLSDQDKKDAKDAIDNATNKGEVDKAVEDAQKKNDQAAQDALAKAKEDAKNTIKALENLTDDEKAPFNKQVDDATTIPEVEKAVLDAQKADAKKKVDGMSNLSDQDKQDAKDAIDKATNKGEVDKAVEDAQNKNDQNQSLDTYKEDAKKKIDA